MDALWIRLLVVRTTIPSTLYTRCKNVPHCYIPDMAVMGIDCLFCKASCKVQVFMNVLLSQK